MACLLARLEAMSTGTQELAFRLRTSFAQMCIVVALLRTHGKHVISGRPHVLQRRDSHILNDCGDDPCSCRRCWKPIVF